MKLYATTTSERASKGQGGENLDIVIYNEKKQPAICIQVQTNATGKVLALIARDIRYSYIQFQENTGFLEIKKKCTHDYDNYGKCTECGHWQGADETKGNKQIS